MQRVPGCGRGAFKGLALLAGASLGAGAQASNGLNLVGFGAESLGLGSADVAVARDANAVNINPAGLTQIAQRRFDAYLVPFYSFGLSHQDSYNADYDIDNPFGVLTGGGYAWKALHPDLTFGVGLFLSGGTGVNYDELNTAFGTRDEYSAVLGITKFATGVGWRVNERLSLGAGLNLTYSQLRQKVFPNTASEAAGFFGLRVDGADGFTLNGRIGLQYRLTPALTVGLSYASETEVKLEDGTATLNYGTFDGLGHVKYGEARVEGFALAQELGAGLAWKFRPGWMLAAELTWLDWSRALGDATLRVSSPDNPAAPATVSVPQPLDHKDQYIVGLGLEYEWSPRTVLRVGTNIAQTAIPAATLTPVLNLTADWELDLGIAHKLRNGWELASTLQFQPYKSEQYDNPLFGSASEDYGVMALTLQLSRAW